MEHYLIARLEGGAVRLNVVGVGLMALGSAKMKAEFSAKHHECGSKTGGLVHCGPEGEAGPGNKVIPNIVVGVIYDGWGW